MINMTLDSLALISFSFIFNFHFKCSKATAQQGLVQSGCCDGVPFLQYSALFSQSC